jgi:hypothetical protein
MNGGLSARGNSTEVGWQSGLLSGPSQRGTRLYRRVGWQSGLLSGPSQRSTRLYRPRDMEPVNQQQIPGTQRDGASWSP